MRVLKPVCFAEAVLLVVCAVATRANAQAQNSGDAVKTVGRVDPKRAKLIADTKRLSALSKEVQAELAKNGPDTLSLGLVKKVEELQKLAAVVKAEVGKVQ